MTNYVRHSVRKVPQPRMELTVQEHDGKVILTVLDTGPPFNPLTAPPPDLSDDIDQRRMGGMGLHLVRSYCDRMHYVRERVNRPGIRPVALRTLVLSARSASVIVKVIQGRHDVAEDIPGESSDQEERTEHHLGGEVQLIEEQPRQERRR